MKDLTRYEILYREMKIAIAEDEILQTLRKYLTDYVLSKPMSGIIKISCEFNIKEIEDDKIMASVKKDIKKRENEIISFYKPLMQNEKD